MSRKKFKKEVSGTPKNFKDNQTEKETEKEKEPEKETTPNKKPTSKLYLGNISFNSTEETLTKQFTIFGEVKECTVVRRGTKSLGYGFIKMGSVESATKAIEGLNKKEIDGREIVVEYSYREDIQGKKENKKNKRSYENVTPKFSNNYNTYFNVLYQDPYSYSPHMGGVYDYGNVPNYSNGNNMMATGGYIPPQTSGTNTSYNQYSEYPGYLGYSSNYYNKKYHRRNKGYYKQNFDKRKPSETSILITNIPFNFRSQDLLETFKDLNPTRAKVMITKNGRSRGFGFVDFKYKEGKEAALELNEIEIDGRTVCIKTAFDPIRAFEEM
ncbi:RNA recognition motif rrm domain containing protein [Anaeramoeba flamelloides]|uniref:RNA recognition motif rrm domain containing protein n=1 Tax=Anaeramoeba flamelloides TaxID=1746091 RepID=A0AAV7Z0C4_9EUKA|nr:RNA recognition motif rrm domain containing protein [Anaeramoeba flamelloides]